MEIVILSGGRGIGRNLLETILDPQQKIFSLKMWIVPKASVALGFGVSILLFDGNLSNGLCLRKYPGFI